MARGPPLVLAAVLLLSALPLTAPPASAADAKAMDHGLSQPMVGIGAAQVGSYVYLFGGRMADGTYSNQIVRYDPATGANQTVALFPNVTIAPGSSERYAGSVVAHGTKIYYFGGATSVQGTVGGQPARLPKPIPDIVVFDTTTNKATVLSEQVGKQSEALPGEGAWGMSLVAVGSTAYLFGGFTLDISTYNFQRHDWILAFDMDAETLDQLPAKLPYPVQDAGAARVGSSVYLFGGLADNNTANLCPGQYVTNQTTGQPEYQRPSLCLTDQILRWDPGLQGDAEVATAKLPYRVQFSSAGAVGNLGYVLGGLLVDGTASQAILEFNPASGTPLRTLTPRLDPGMFGSGLVPGDSTLTLWGGRTGDANQLTASIVTFDPGPTAPYPPAGLAATRSDAAIHLTWQPPTYDGDSPVTGYRVFRTGPDAVETLLTPTPTTGLSYDDAAVKPGANYTYRVTARNSIGESAGASLSTATGTTVPGAVASFSAYPGHGEAVLKWAAPAENGGSDLTGYHAYCNCSDRPASLDPATLTYAWSGLADGVSYAFSVRAVNAKGEGAASPTVHVTPAPVPDAPLSVQAQPAGGSGSSATGIAVSWVPSSSPVTRFLVLRGPTPDAIAQPVANLSADQTAYTDQAVQQGNTYYYAVVSVNAVGASPPAVSGAVALVDPPGPPTHVQAVGLEGLVQLTWNAPLDLGHATPSAITYVVTRTSPGATVGRIISPPGLKETSFADRTATPGLAYSYTVTAQNPVRGAPSDALTATAKVVTNKPPVAGLTILPAIATAGDPVTLDATLSHDPDGSIAQYAFDFGDGSDLVRTANATQTHAYAQNGTYEAKVVVTDNRGNVSAPVSARVIVGTLVDANGNAGGDVSGATGGPRPVTTGSAPSQPGSGTPKLIPAPGVGLVALALVALAVARRHLRR